jgi:VWFA-related protein
MRSSVLAILCAGLCLSSASAQQPEPRAGQPAVTFRSEANYVDVDVIVTNGQGEFVRNLTRDDFEVFEDGRPQQVEMFSFVDLPVESGSESSKPFLLAGRPIANDVRTNAQALTGRMYVIVLDDLDTSLFRGATVIRTARRFIERNLGPNDVAAVVYSSGRPDAQQDFTTERPLLLAAVDKFVGRKLRSYTLDKIDFYFNQLDANKGLAASLGYDKEAASAGPMPGTNTGSESSGFSTDPGINPNTRGDGYPDRTGDAEDFERGFRALGVLGTLRDLADFMGSIHGRRKALLLFSEGIDYATTDIFQAQEATTVVKAIQDAIAAAARANVSIFGIDPRGMVGMSADALGDLVLPGAVSDPAAASMGATLPSFASEIRLSQDSLHTLSEETGGFASVGNDPEPFFDRVVRANSTYYMLAYRSPSRSRDGRFHKIEVRVKRPGVRVTARKTYANPRGPTPEEKAADEQKKALRNAKRGGADTTSAELREGLNGPMQQGGVTMKVQAVPFRHTAKEASVAIAIEMDGGNFRFEPRSNGVLADNFELSYFGINEQSKPLLGTRHQVEVSLKTETSRQVQQAGLRMNPRITLAPGRYQLRIGLRESGNGSMGTVFCDVQVPDFSHEPLSMSGMLITSGSSKLVPTVLSDNLVGHELLPGPATSSRTFPEGDTLAAYVEIYDNLRVANNVVAVTTRLVAEDGREVFTSRDVLRAPARRNDGPATLAVSRSIPLKDVRPGRYLLQVEAQPPGSGMKTVSREAVLTVVAGEAR